MDPITQGALGGVFAQAPAPPKHLAKAAVIGALSGMAADLDVLIRSSRDPLLALQFHRHFTHSLFFIPVGALVVCLFLHPLLGKRWRLSSRLTYLWCLIGYSTHALLDGCTTYGTQLLWPFTNQRFAWDLVSVIDPLFTLPLLAAVAMSAKFKKRRFAMIGIAWGVLYLGLGWLQHDRAVAMGKALAKVRGHNPTRIEVKPSFGNIVVWKAIYESDGFFYVDALKPGLFEETQWEGEHVAKLDVARDLPWLKMDSQQAKDIERFRWFSMDYLAQDKRDPTRVVDIRYSMLPDQIKPLWGIELTPGAALTEHVDYFTDRERPRGAVDTLLQMIF